MQPCRSVPTSAFTLLELLVVLSVVALILSLLLPSLGKVREQGRRTACLNNVRQLVTASLMYAQENERGSYTADTRGHPNERLDKDDDLSPLFPGLIPALDSFVCPSTHNRVRPDLTRVDPWRDQVYLSDLASYDHGRDDPGMSYECFGVMGWTRRKTFNSVNTYSHQSALFSLQGLRPGPSQIWLILDGERGDNNLTSGNHGSAGANVGFCDGHAAWVRAREWPLAYEISQDEGRTHPPDHLRVGTY